MITINLLPYELRPVKRTPLPYLASALVLVLVIIGVLIKGLVNQSRIGAVEALYREHEAALKVLEPVVDTYNKLSQRQIKLRDKVDAITEITSDRIIWSQQLFHLARLALDNFWYDGIKVSTRVITVNKTEIDPKTKKKKVTKQKIEKHVLTVSGFVTGGGEKGGLGPFIRGTESDEEFSKLFQLESVEELVDTEFSGKKVRRFEIEYSMTPKGSAKK